MINLTWSFRNKCKISGNQFAQQLRENITLTFVKIPKIE